MPSWCGTPTGACKYNKRHRTGLHCSCTTGCETWDVLATLRPVTVEHLGQCADPIASLGMDWRGPWSIIPVSVSVNAVHVTQFIELEAAYTVHWREHEACMMTLQQDEGPPEDKLWISYQLCGLPRTATGCRASVVLPPSFTRATTARGRHEDNRLSTGNFSFIHIMHMH